MNNERNSSPEDNKTRAQTMPSHSHTTLASSSSCSSLSPGSSIWPSAAAGPHLSAHANDRKPPLFNPLNRAFPSYQASISKSIYHSSSSGGGKTSSNQTSSNKYHRAAIEGYVDMLCEASKRDTNLAAQDQLELTPTLLAAQNGHLDALRILVGRGGDPERVSSSGASALHLAAARNHLNCVSFLVNFGVNMWALDNDLHTAKDVAAMEQQKLVLDYLDQMMAKQSAINTKSVQKLKERAKLAAEKRIKRMRKAQMKAIKQVERDERLLAKMSSNRRLLRAARSISDIELVGRSHEPGWPPAAVASISSGGPLGPRQQNSPSANKLASYITQRQQADLLARSRHKLISDLQFDPQPFQESRERLHDHKRQQSDFESSYSSSVSSTSGYLSSSSARSILRAVIRRGPRRSPKDETGRPDGGGGDGDKRGSCDSRPKFSDLVKQTCIGDRSVDHDRGAAKSKCPIKTKTSSDKQSMGAKAGSMNEMVAVSTNGGESTVVSSSSSSSSSKLRGFSGVSRKVHLRRLLFAAQSSPKSSAPVDANKTKHKQGMLTTNLPSSKSDHHQHQRSQPSTTSDEISWPPAPSLTRAISEPDFNQAALQRRLLDGQRYRDDEDDSEQDDANSSDTHEQQVERARSGTPASKCNLEQAPLPPDPPQPPPPPSPPIRQMSTLDVDVVVDGKMAAQDRVRDQQQLLTKCLSQLKLQHEAISRSERTGPAEGEHLFDQHHQELLKPSKLIALTRHQQHQFSRSDELIRHQLNAGEFPLRPSVIKQQQQQQQQHQHSHANESQPNMSRSSGNNKSTTIVSVDSIGSADSFARRNCPTSSCSDSTSSSGSSSASFKSSCRASGERSRFDHNNNNNLDDNCQVDPNDNLSKFLASNGLGQLNQVLQRECIDLEALLLLSEDDLKSLNILLGPRKKLLNAIERQRALLMSSAVGGDEKAKQQQQQMFVVVDTQF